jgi:hypothetical protein
MRVAKVTTARILANKALQEPCGRDCVDWAVRMLEEGQDSPHLRILAGELPPYNHFEVAQLRDAALRELDLLEPAGDVAVRMYAVERLRAALTGDEDLIEVLTVVKDFCVSQNYQKDLYDFYLLFFAHSDLQEEPHQWYWAGATRANILSLIRKRASEFVADADGANA